MGEAARVEQQVYVVRLAASSAKLDRTVTVCADSANEAIREALAQYDREHGLDKPPARAAVHPLPPEWNEWKNRPTQSRPADLEVSIIAAQAEAALESVKLPGTAPENDNAAAPRDTIGGRDEGWLTRYFGDARAERSPSGAILDVAELYSYREPVERMDYGDDPPAGVELLERLDAQPTRESRESSREGPDDERLIVLGVVSRRLAVVRRLDPLSFSVLAAFYGDQGALHARGDFGREGALVQFTRSGKKLAKLGARRSRGSKRKATDGEHVANEMIVSIARARSGLAAAGAGEEGGLIARGLAEARDLLARAARAWNSTAPMKSTAHGE